MAEQRLINAKAFHKFIEKQDEGADYTIYHFKEWLEQQPIIEAKPVVHGHWETNSDRPDSLICSVCNCGFDMWKHDSHNFCPNCGAKMDETVEDDNGC